MLCARDAYALNLACKHAQVSFEQVSFITKNKESKAFGAAMFYSKKSKWSLSRAKEVYNGARYTPFKTKRSVVLWLLKYVLDPENMWRLGYENNNSLAMRIALRKLSAKQKQKALSKRLVIS